ncbi:MAG: flippase-like domain-containing protein, partial [Chloroflexi bacterium]|nr:flippase-like domain-containing protein [Chloroflexota bacterium]
AELWGTLARADYWLVPVAAGTITATSMAQTARWRLLLYPRHRQRRYGNLRPILFIGQMVNIVIPARLGELARAYLVGEIEGESKALSLGTIAVEKAVDLFMVLFLLVGLLLAMAVPRWVQEPGVEVATVTLVLLGALVLSAHYKERLLSAFGRLLRVLPELAQVRLMEHLEAVLDSLEVFRRWDVSLRVGGWSVLIWLLAASTNYITFLALRLHLPFLAAVFLLVVLQVGVAVPSSPGKVGVFHYLCLLALSVFGVERSLALSYGLLLYFIVFLPPILLGVFFLGWENVSWRRLKRRALEAEVT